MNGPFDGVVLVFDRTIEEGEENVVLSLPREVPYPADLLCKIRSSLAALTGVGEGITGSKAQLTTLTVGGDRDRRQFRFSVGDGNGYSVGVAISNRTGHEVVNLALSIVQTIKYRLGDLPVSELIQKIAVIEYYINQYIARLSTSVAEINNVPLLEGLVPGFRPSPLLKTRLSTLLSVLEMASHSDLSSVTVQARFCFPIGSCLFRKGRCIESHLDAPDLLDVARLCCISGFLDRTHDDGIVVVWHDVFPSKLDYSTPPSHILMVVAVGDLTLCLLANNLLVHRLPGHVDPFLIADMKALLWEFDQELLARVDVEMAQLHELVVPIDAIPSTLVNTGPTAKHGEQAVVAPRPPSAPSSPKIRRRSRSNSPQNSPRPIPNAPSAIRLTVGKTNALLHYRIIDRIAGIVEESTLSLASVPAEIAIYNRFKSVVLDMEAKFRPEKRKSLKQRDDLYPKPILEIKQKGEMNGDLNKKRFLSDSVSRDGATELGAHFVALIPSTIVPNAKYRRSLTSLKLRRRMPPNNECYVCFEDSTCQNMIDMAFQLLYAWI